MLHDLSTVIVGRLLLAAVLGGVVGLERELRHKPAGLRTNMLISVGAALFTTVSMEAASRYGGDPTRIASQIIPGIGFIGAGVVIRERGAVMGITSAATIFVIASVGMAVGAGLPVSAIFTTFVLLAALVVLGIAEDRLGLHMRLLTFSLTTAAAQDLVEPAQKIVHDLGIQPRRWQSRRLGELTLIEFDAEVTYPQERDLLTRLGALDVHCEARPIRL